MKHPKGLIRFHKQYLFQVLVSIRYIGRFVVINNNLKAEVKANNLVLKDIKPMKFAKPQVSPAVGVFFTL